MSAPTTRVTTRTLDAPGVTLYYEVRGSGPLLAIVGAPMEAAFFAPLADALSETFTVVTTDPRGIAHSVLDEPDRDSTPVDRAEDLHRVLTALDAGPAHVFGSSGGAVTAIALAERYPGDVRTIVAHEPPLPMLLDDRDELLAQADDIRDTFLRGGQGRAWGKYRAAISAAGTRIVVGAAEDSTGQLCDRTSAAMADGLCVDVARFPGNHGGFLRATEPLERRLRDVLGG